MDRSLWDVKLVSEAMKLKADESWIELDSDDYYTEVM